VTRLRFALAVALACGLVASPASAKAPGPSPEGEAAKLHDAKELVFADDVDRLLSLGDKAARGKKPAPGAAKDPMTELAGAWARKRKGDAAGARAIVRAVLAAHPGESRVELLCWSALRQLGEAPSEADGQRVLGVVVEVPQPRGLDTLAAYADGRARYFNQAGGAVIWEEPDRPEGELARDVVNRGQQAIELVPAVAKRTPSGGAIVRVTLLTPGGLHVKEGSFDELGAGPLSPTVDAATRLLQALVEAGLASKKKDGASAAP
jgi:hypothetical protein